MLNRFEEFDEPVRGSTTLQTVSRFTKYAASETIISEEEDSNNVYFLLKGRVKITNFSASGREVWHNELGPGNTFGEMAAISGNPRAASIVAMEDTEVAILSKAEFFGLMRHEPELCFWVMEELVERLNLATVKFYELLSFSIPLRVRAEVLRLAEASSGGRDEILPLPNFSELAKRINTNRENVSREISSLARRKAILKSKDKIVILDRTFLEETTAV